MRNSVNLRSGRVIAIAAVLLFGLVPSLAGALSISTGNGRASVRDRAAVLPGEARTEARLFQMELSKALGRGELPVNLGQITAEAAKGGGLYSELILEGIRMGEDAFPTVAYHSDGDERSPRQDDDVTITVKKDALQSSLALADWYLNSALSTGAVSRLELLSGTVGVPGLGLKANIGERGFVSEVTHQQARARFAITIENLAVTLDSILPDVTLPLGTSLDMVTRLQLPLGETLSGSVARAARLVDDLRLVEDTLGELDQLRRTLDGVAGDNPAVQAALAAVDAAEAAVATAAADLASATAAVDPARTAADSAAAASAAADAAVAAAQQDLAAAAATVTSLQATVANLDAQIAALQAELASTLNPARLLALPGEILALQNTRSAALADLASADAARSNAVALLNAAEGTAVTKRAAADTAAATLAAAESAVAAAAAAAAGAQQTLAGAQAAVDAAIAAAAAAGTALDGLTGQREALEGRLRTLLQGVSDLLAGLPPLPVLQQDLDDALRSADLLAVGGLQLETAVEADADGSRNLVHCNVERVTVLGFSPRVRECTDLIAVEKEAVRRVNDVLHGLGAVGVDGVQLLGPGGTWSEPGPVGPDGIARSDAQMSALRLVIPRVSLNGVAANLLGEVEQILALIQRRPAASAALPVISPRVGAAAMRTASLPAAAVQQTTLAGQIRQLSDELGKAGSPADLADLSTGAVRLVVAEARTVVSFDTNRLTDQDTTDPTQVCGGDPVCLAQCAAGQCPDAASSGGGDPLQSGGGTDAGAGTDPGVSGDVPDPVSVDVGAPGDPSGAKLPMTGAAGGLTAVALLALGGAGAGWVRRRPARRSR